jgi:TetR/AcrR family transcriptional regulator, fatty acid metabolism regulator protein
MAGETPRRRARSGEPAKSSPPGRKRIMEALQTLLAEKAFAAITTAEIARTAQVTEPLIYKYFSDKRDLLHQVLADYVEYRSDLATLNLKGIKGSLNKLHRLVWFHLNMYDSNRVFAKILLLEVRNYPDYFKSEAYQMVTRYATAMLEVIEEGVAAGEIRSDVPPKTIRQLVLGGIEHICLPGVIFNQEIPVDELTEHLCEMLFTGIAETSGK